MDTKLFHKLPKHSVSRAKVISLTKFRVESELLAALVKFLVVSNLPKLELIITGSRDYLPLALRGYSPKV
jgi:hypothetical protein